jgi:hypothetical protein
LVNCKMFIHLNVSRTRDLPACSVEPQPLSYSVARCFLQTNRTGSKISCPLPSGYSALQSAETWVPWELVKRAICPSDPHLTLSRNSLVIVIFSCKWRTCSTSCSCYNPKPG